MNGGGGDICAGVGANRTGNSRQAVEMDVQMCRHFNFMAVMAVVSGSGQEMQ